MRILGGFAYGVSMAALAAGLATEAHAGAFAIREQSAYYQGSSFAGAGTGDTLSSMYWNSAAAAAAPGINSESHVSIIAVDSEITADSGVAIAPPAVGGLGLNPESGDLSDPALVPASYVNYQATDRLFFGLALNSGFGLVTKPDNELWAGSPIAVTSDVFSINVNPTIAYKLTPELTVGAGIQIEYLDVRLRNLSRDAELDDVGIGFTAGATWTPAQGTTLGIGWRSGVDFDLEGDFNVVGGPTLAAAAEMTLPDIVTIGLRQRLTDRVDLLAGFEWTNWSELGNIPVTGTPESLRLNYDDGYFYSLGLEYKYSPSTLLRAGIAYEESPISDEERNVLLPDANRIWLSVGATYKYSEKVSFDLGYTHIFLADDATICRAATADAAPCSAAPGVPALIDGEADASVNIISASFKYKWGAAEPELEPLK